MAWVAGVDGGLWWLELVVRTLAAGLTSRCLGAGAHGWVWWLALVDACWCLGPGGRGVGGRQPVSLAGGWGGWSCRGGVRPGSGWGLRGAVAWPGQRAVIALAIMGFRLRLNSRFMWSLSKYTATLPTTA